MLKGIRTTNTSLPLSRQNLSWLVWVLLPLLTIVLYLPIIPDLIRDWTSDADSEHGILVPFMSAWLIWRKRNDLRTTPIRACWWGLAGTAAAFAVYGVCYLGHVAVLARVSFVFFLYFLVLFTLGPKMGRELRFPLLFLLFMVPVPVSVRALIAFPLQLFASKVSAALLDAMGVVVVREGNVLHLANTSLEVAAACSGIRSMISYLMLGVFFSYVSRNRAPITVALLILAIPIALAANIVRVVSSGLLASWLGPKAAEGFLHETSGLLMFAGGFVVFLFLNSLLNRIWSAPKISGQSKKDEGSRAGSPIEEQRSPRFVSSAVAVLFLFGSILAVQAMSRRARVEIVDPRLADFPFTIGDWEGKRTRFAEEERINQILGVDISVLRVYRRGSDTVTLYVGYYGTEKGGRSSHNPESCYVGGGWTIQHRGLAELILEGSREAATVSRLVAASGEWREEILHWYQVAGTRVVHGGITLNLLRFWRGLRENRNDGAFVRVTSRVDPADPERALGLAREFSAEIIPLFPSYWPVEREVASKQATSGGQLNRKGK